MNYFFENIIFFSGFLIGAQVEHGEVPGHVRPGRLPGPGPQGDQHRRGAAPRLAAAARTQSSFAEGAGAPEGSGGEDGGDGGGAGIEAVCGGLGAPGAP